MCRQSTAEVFHSEYCIRKLRQPVYGEPMAQMPSMDDARYSKYPFIVARYRSYDNQMPLRVFIHSELLLEMIVEALHLSGDPDTLRSQNGLQLLHYWADLRIYLEQKRLEIAWVLELEPHCLENLSPTSSSVIQLRDKIAELELLVHGFLENDDILSEIGLDILYKDGLLTLEHYNAIDNIHQDLGDIWCAFHEIEDLEDQDPSVSSVGLDTTPVVAR